MLQRTITGAFILLFTVAFVLLTQVSGLFFDAFALIIMFVSLYEVINAYKLTDKRPTAWALYLVPALMCLIFNLTDNVFSALLWNALLAIALFICLITNDIIKFAIDRKKGTTEKNVSVLNQKLFEKTKITLSIYAYPLLPLMGLLAVNHLPYEVGYIGIVLIFVVAMLTDTMAYLVGRLFGRRKFVPEVSPKKTIAGVIGGFVGGILGALVCYFIFYYTDMFTVLNLAGKGASIAALLIIGAVGSYITQLGDLVASAMKRKVGIKDFSNIFPGHGGFMDRMDGLMFVSVFVYVIMTLFFV